MKEILIKALKDKNLDLAVKVIELSDKLESDKSTLIINCYKSPEAMAEILATDEFEIKLKIFL